MKLDEVAYTRGSQLMQFNDYLMSLPNSVNTYVLKHFGVKLFKDNFTFEGFNFYKTDFEGEWEFILPGSSSSDAEIQQGYVRCLFQTRVEGVIMLFDETLVIEPYLTQPLANLKDHMRENVSPR